MIRSYSLIIFTWSALFRQSPAGHPPVPWRWWPKPPFWCLCSQRRRRRCCSWWRWHRQCFHTSGPVACQAGDAQQPQYRPTRSVCWPILKKQVSWIQSCWMKGLNPELERTSVYFLSPCNQVLLGSLSIYLRLIWKTQSSYLMMSANWVYKLAALEQQWIWWDFMLIGEVPLISYKR